jgi:hypothetical protein
LKAEPRDPWGIDMILELVIRYNKYLKA